MNQTIDFQFNGIFTAPSMDSYRQYNPSSTWSLGTPYDSAAGVNPIIGIILTSILLVIAIYVTISVRRRLKRKKHRKDEDLWLMMRDKWFNDYRPAMYMKFDRLPLRYNFGHIREKDLQATVMNLWNQDYFVRILLYDNGRLLREWNDSAKIEILSYEECTSQDFITMIAYSTDELMQKSISKYEVWLDSLETGC